MFDKVLVMIVAIVVAAVVVVAGIVVVGVSVVVVVKYGGRSGEIGTENSTS